MTHRDEHWARDNFTERYSVATRGAASEVERQVIGAAWGANGYTTRDQADVLGDRLALSPTSRLLDLGAGRGWPGLYLAVQYGCTVVLADMPREGLAIAMASARERGLESRAAVVMASAYDLPLRAASFDAVVHTDVLCCLSAKLSVLRATKRALKPGGRTAFFTIYVPDDVPRRARRRALGAAPKYGSSRAALTQLMRSAGFVDINETDYTRQYHTTLNAWRDHTANREEELDALWGHQLFTERQADWCAAIDAVEAGWQRRVLISASRPRPKQSATPHDPTANSRRRTEN